jgi:radical SAM superfamily enzyme YgiQ (UPF0313 family)
MTITFIIPPSGFLADERVFPMIGVLKVAAALEARGHTVDVLDLSGTTDVVRETEDYVKAQSSRCYGITATTPQMPAAARVVGAIRRANPFARVVLGGSHVTLVNAAAKRGVVRAQAMLAELLTRFDALVAGDGEYAAEAAFTVGAPPVIDADDPTSAYWMTPDDIEETGYPARHLLNLASYRYAINGVPTTSVIAQLGCPFGCGFCGGRNSATYRRMRLRAPVDVAEELGSLYTTYGYRGFMFYDDELNVNKAIPEMLTAIINVQRRLGVRFTLRGFVKAELFTDDQAAAMVDAGFVSLLSGVESGSDRMLQNMRKRSTVAENTRCLTIARRHGLRMKALVSIGHPGESRDTIAETRAWLLAERPDDVDISIITVYPGAPYFDDAVQTGPTRWTYRVPRMGDALHARAFGQFVDAPYYKGVPGSYESFVSTDALSEADLVRERDTLERDVRQALAMPSPTAAAQQFDHSMGMR